MIVFVRSLCIIRMYIINICSRREKKKLDLTYLQFDVQVRARISYDKNEFESVCIVTTLVFRKHVTITVCTKYGKKIILIVLNENCKNAN